MTSDIGVTLIVVVCVGFLLFMIVLGVIRIRAAHQKSQVVTVDPDRPEMEWDNSALTITVNPMEQQVMVILVQESMNQIRSFLNPGFLKHQSIIYD